ncbi:MAG: hypothetical protein A2085_03785 [Gemmatimonadetes bacterium GWC2_71_10]|nr:MAG: hypothetical protein A2085_03785 [Gemmatimonadetes bacterium GWC2_71_10]
MFERLRARLEAAMAAATKAEDPRTAVGRMREALIEMRAAVGPMRDAVAETDRQLAAARAELETARRRRDMAATIGDQETVTVAEKYATKLGERVAVLERKAAAQREELNLAEADLTEFTTQFNDAVKQRGGESAGQSAEQAWQSLGQAGMDRPGADPDDELLRGRMDRAALEAEANARLEEMKRKMGK